MGNGLKPFTPSVRGAVLPPMMGGITILPIWIGEAVRLCLLDYYHRSIGWGTSRTIDVDKWDLSALASPRPMTKAQTQLIDRLNASMEIRETPPITDQMIGGWDRAVWVDLLQKLMAGKYPWLTEAAEKIRSCTGLAPFSKGLGRS